MPRLAPDLQTSPDISQTWLDLINKSRLKSSFTFKKLENLNLNWIWGIGQAEGSLECWQKSGVLLGQVPRWILIQVFKCFEGKTWFQTWFIHWIKSSLGEVRDGSGHLAWPVPQINLNSSYHVFQGRTWFQTWFINWIKSSLGEVWRSGIGLGIWRHRWLGRRPQTWLDLINNSSLKSSFAF